MMPACQCGAVMVADARSQEYVCPACGARLPVTVAASLGLRFNPAAVAMMFEALERKAPAVPAVPDYFEPILAWRVWGLRRSMQWGPDPEPRLVSRGVTWEPFEALEAQHRMDSARGAIGGGGVDPRCPGSPCDGHVPHQAPKCGVYGFKDPERLRAAVEHAHWFGGPAGIIGAVWLWGRLVEHEHGWRGQFAYPARFVWLDLHDETETTGPQLAQAYGVPYEEDASWKSESQSGEWFRNLFQAQYLSVFPSPRVPFRPVPIQRPIVLSTVPKSRSLSLYRPSDLALIAKPTVRELARVCGAPHRARVEVYEQPSFHIHRPITWWKDGAGLWRRSERVRGTS